MAEPRYRDYRDMVIDDLAQVLATTSDALVDALRDRDAYQLLAKVAIEQNATLTTANTRLRTCVAQRLDVDSDPRLSESAEAA